MKNRLEAPVSYTHLISFLMRIFWIFTGICLKVMSEKKKYLNIKSADHGFL